MASISSRLVVRVDYVASAGGAGWGGRDGIGPWPKTVRPGRRRLGLRLCGEGLGYPPAPPPGSVLVTQHPANVRVRVAVTVPPPVHGGLGQSRLEQILSQVEVSGQQVSEARLPAIADGLMAATR